jgi:hypothetical protein
LGLQRSAAGGRRDVDADAGDDGICVSTCAGGREADREGDIYSFELLSFFVLTGKHALDPTWGPRRLVKAIDDLANVELPGVKPELVELIRSMVAVDRGERPDSARAVFDAICQNEFALFEEVDAVAIRVELAKFGVDDRFESETSHFRGRILRCRRRLRR